MSGWQGITLWLNEGDFLVCGIDDWFTINGDIRFEIEPYWIVGIFFEWQIFVPLELDLQIKVGNKAVPVNQFNFFADSFQ